MPSPPAWMQDAAAWGATVALQGTLLALLVLVADAALRRLRATPSLRMALWSVVAVRFVLPAHLHSPFSLTSGFFASRGGAVTASAAPASPSAAAWLVAAWAAGSIVLAAMTLRRAAATRRRLLSPERRRPVPPRVARAAAEAASLLRLRRVPRLVVTAAVDSPVVLGLLRPVVLFPASGPLAASRRDARHALLHEFAHLRRRDPADGAAATALRILWWWNPVAWWVAARLDALREACCDATAAAALGHRPEGYRATLLRAARAAVERTPAPALAMAGGPAGVLRERLRHLDAGRAPSTAQRALPALAAAALLGCVVPMAPAAPAAGGAAPGAEATAHATAPTDDDDGLDEARNLLAALDRGEKEAGCFRYRFAAMRVAAAEASVNRNAGPASDAMASAGRRGP